MTRQWLAFSEHALRFIIFHDVSLALRNAPGIFGERGLLVSGSRSGATVRCTTVAECMMLPVDGPSTPVPWQILNRSNPNIDQLR